MNLHGPELPPGTVAVLSTAGPSSQLSSYLCVHKQVEQTQNEVTCVRTLLSYQNLLSQRTSAFFYCNTSVEVHISVLNAEAYVTRTATCQLSCCDFPNPCSEVSLPIVVRLSGLLVHTLQRSAGMITEQILP